VGSGFQFRGFSDDANNNNNTEKKDEESTKRIASLEEEIQKLKKEILYSLADQENTRRIAKKDVSDAKAFGVKDFAKNMMEVADTMEKAVASMADYKTEDHTILSFIEGVSNTEKLLLKALKSQGVVSFGAKGEKFDPNIHEALAKVPDAVHPPNTVYKVLRPGWFLNGRVLRAAQVVTTIPAPEIDDAFLRRKVGDKVDEADDLEKLKEKSAK